MDLVESTGRGDEPATFCGISRGIREVRLFRLRIQGRIGKGPNPAGDTSIWADQGLGTNSATALKPKKHVGI